MARYIQQLRRGWKGVDKNGKTTYADGTPVDDWAKYELDPNHMKPLEGELVLEYDNGIPRLKIGDGVSEFSQLPYISVDSFVLPTTVSITLLADKWEKSKDEDDNIIANSWCQEVLQGSEVITPYSKVDLQPSTNQLAIFHEKDLAFVAENEDGVVTVFCVGQQPTNDYTVQATVTEVFVNA